MPVGQLRAGTACAVAVAAAALGGAAFGACGGTVESSLGGGGSTGTPGASSGTSAATAGAAGSCGVAGSGGAVASSGASSSKAASSSGAGGGCGACDPAQDSCCTNTCVDDTNDPFHCGDCDTVCPGPHPFCDIGHCESPPCFSGTNCQQ